MKTNKETIARTIASAVVAVLAVLKMLGIEFGDGLTEEQIYTALLPIVTVLVWIWGFYKNNDFSKEGIAGTKYTRILKMHKKAGDTVEEGDEV